MRPKSTFKPKNKNSIIEMCLSPLEQNLLDIDIPKEKFDKLRQEERDALYFLKININLVIKGVGKGSGVLLYGTGKIV